MNFKEQHEQAAKELNLLRRQLEAIEAAYTPFALDLPRWLFDEHQTLIQKIELQISNQVAKFERTADNPKLARMVGKDFHDWLRIEVFSDIRGDSDVVISPNRYSVLVAERTEPQVVAYIGFTPEAPKIKTFTIELKQFVTPTFPNGVFVGFSAEANTVALYLEASR